MLHINRVIKATSAVLCASCAGLLALSYSSSFSGTENPLSESGEWINGSSASSDFGNMQKTPGLAFGVSLPTTYGDPTAVLTGTWGQSQTAQGTVSIPGATPSGCCSEVEIRLRTSISTNSITGYELLCPVWGSPGYGYQIVRWNGANGQFVYLNTSSAHQCVNGDVLKGVVSGTSPVTIDFYNNGVLVLSACDNGQASGGSCGGNGYSGPGGAAGPFTSGTPGIGMYNSGGSAWNSFGFSDFYSTDGTNSYSGSFTSGPHTRKGPVTSK